MTGSAGSWRHGLIGLACALALFVLLPAAVAGEHRASPLRLVNLNPFHLLYGVPAPFGSGVMPEGASEVIASFDMASHLNSGRAGGERILMDGETYRQALSWRQGLGQGWEYFFEVPAVAHSAGAFDGFIEGWHDVFGLPQGGRDTAPRDRLSLTYADGRTIRADVGRDVLSFGDASFGVGHALPSPPLQNDGMAVRAAVKLPTGDTDSLTGSGGFSASTWVETSGALPGSRESRRWLYAATLGALAGTAPEGLPTADHFIAFGGLGVTWRALEDLQFTVQVDAHSSPYGASGLAALSDTAVILGMGGSLRLTEHLVLDVAVTEDDGVHRSAPDIGLHLAMRWRLQD
ncbi:MAG: DUF3187 family protein [bacterium]|nr:DUF3187 family protein [bacterium]